MRELLLRGKVALIQFTVICTFCLLVLHTDGLAAVVLCAGALATAGLHDWREPQPEVALST